MPKALVIVLLLCAPAAAQDFFTLKGHGGPIMDIEVSTDGKIATASFDNSVGLWSGQEPRWLDGNRAAVNALAFLSDGTVIAGGDDFSVWHLGSDKSDAVQLGEHKGKVTSLAVSPDGNLAASGSWDGSIGLWSLSQFEEMASLRGHKQGVNDVAFSTDGSQLYSASVDGTIRVWDVVSGQEIRQLVKHGFGVNELIVNEPEGWLAYGAVDGGTRIIDIATGAEIADFSLDRRPILALAYDAGGHQLAVGDGEGYIMIIDTKAMKITRDFRATQRGPIWALAFSTNGQNIHAGGIEDIMYSWPVATLDEHGQMAGNARSFLVDPNTLPNGERQFKRKCSICHTLTAGSARKAGPSLYRVFGRQAGTVADYVYSDTLNKSDIIWSADTINALFNEGPDHYIPGTKMPMQRIAKQQDRDDLIEYLSTATVQREN